MSLAALKEKMQKIKDSIDGAEDRETEAMTALREAKAREEVQLNETDSMRRRISLLSEELRKTEERLEEVDDKLENLKGVTTTHEEVRKELEGCEMEEDEKIVELETKMKEMEHQEKETVDKLNEAQRRDVVLSREYEKAVDKGEILLQKVEELENTIERTASKITRLEEHGEETYEREEENEEKIKFLDEQVKLCLQRYDDAEREMQKLERLTDQIQLDIDVKRENKVKILEEMEDLTDMDF